MKNLFRQKLFEYIYYLNILHKHTHNNDHLNNGAITKSAPSGSLWLSSNGAKSSLGYQVKVYRFLTIKKLVVPVSSVIYVII